MKKIVAAAGRERFLNQALALCAAFVEPQDKASSFTLVVDEATRERMIGIFAGSLIGAMCGLFLGAMLWIPADLLTSHFSDRLPSVSNLVFLVSFFGFGFGGLYLGAIIGRRVLAGFIASTLRKRRERK